MAVRKLTKREIDRLIPGERDSFYYDPDLPGFGLRVASSGRKYFFIQYGDRRHRKRMTLGLFGVLTAEVARERARKELAKPLDGKDPLREREERRAMPTFPDWVADYLKGAKERKKSVREDERYLGLARGSWGGRPLDAVGVNDVERVMQSLAKAGHRIAANRFLASVRACLQAAWRAGVIRDNPAMRVKPYRENPPRAVVLTDKELARFVKALEREHDPFVRAAFHLLIETGARKSEVLRARWDDFDFDSNPATWRIPSPKAGNPQTLPLAERTVAMLRRLPHLGPFVIPGRNPSRPRAEIRDQWDELRTRAKLREAVTIHDLRRTFGQLARREAGLQAASGLLRHADVRVTERVYAHMDLEDLGQAAEKVAKVLPMPSRQARREKREAAG